MKLLIIPLLVLSFSVLYLLFPLQVLGGGAALFSLLLSLLPQKKRPAFPSHEQAVRICLFFYGKKNRDSIYLIAHNGGKSKWFSQPADVYLYQTEDPGLCKFGISHDYRERARSCRREWKPLYHKYLVHFRCDSRAEALLIEAAMPRVEHSLTFEVTNIGAETFLRICDERHAEYQKLGTKGYLAKYHAPILESLDSQISGLVSGELVPILNTLDPKSGLYLKPFWPSDIDKIMTPAEIDQYIGTSAPTADSADAQSLQG